MVPSNLVSWEDIKSAWLFAASWFYGSTMMGFFSAVAPPVVVILKF